MFNEEALKRLRERASSDFDIRDLLAEYDRLTKAPDVEPIDERALRRMDAFRADDSEYRERRLQERLDRNEQ